MQMIFLKSCPEQLKQSNKPVESKKQDTQPALMPQKNVAKTQKKTAATKEGEKKIGLGLVMFHFM